MLVTDTGSAAAAVIRGPIPPVWRQIEDVRLFQPGLYLKSGAGVERIADSAVTLGEAVVYAVWEDPTRVCYQGDREIRPGLTAAMLIRSTDSDGPPWIPLQASIDPNPRELEYGLLSPWLDQTACVRFVPQTTVKRGKLLVSTARNQPAVADHEALGATLRWLATHPEAEGAAARAARVMLVDCGHGLQRFGVSLMGASDDVCSAAIDEVLTPLAPAVGGLMRALFDVCTNPHDSSDARARLAAEVNIGLAPEGPLLHRSALALVVTWLAGLFGARPEREGRQPARALFATARALRRSGRHADAVLHADGLFPSLPLDRAASRRVVRDLSHLPQKETDFERLVRALAVAEAGWEIARPRKEHLRPFRIAHPWLQDCPNASRSLSGRYDYILTGWSFRGAEIRGRAVDDHLIASLITDAPSIASTRAYARVLAGSGPAPKVVSRALGASDHPVSQLLSELPGMTAEAVLERYRDAATHANITRRRLFTAVGCAEFLIARGEVDVPVEGFELLPPQRPSDEESAVRGHFMYWRMFCRSIAWGQAAIYGEFLGEIFPSLGELEPKLQTEVFALCRRWSAHSVEHRASAHGHVESLTGGLTGWLAAEDRGRYGGEWLVSLMGALAVLDPDAWVVSLERLVADDRFDPGVVDRLLEGPRSAGWRDQLIASPSFASLHGSLCPGTAARTARSRVEWIRAAVSRSKNDTAVRWMLDGRAELEIATSEAMATWFRARGLAALEDADAAVLELAILGVEKVGSGHLDLAARHLAVIADDLQGVVERLLGSRPLAVVHVARLADRDDWLPEAVARLTTKVASGEELREVALALRRLDEGAAQVARESLREAYARYRPHRYALEGFGCALDGWRLADLGPEGPIAAALADKATRWVLDEPHPSLHAFLAYLAESDATRVLAPAVTGALAAETSDAVVVAALRSLRLPSSLSFAAEAAAGSSKRQPVRRLRDSVTDGDRCGLIDAAVASAVLARLPDEMTAESAASLSLGLSRIAHAIEAAFDGEVERKHPIDAVADSPQRRVAPLAHDGDRVDTDAHEAAGAESEASPLELRRRRRTATALATALHAWDRRMDRLIGAGAATRALLTAATTFAAAPLHTRGDFLAAAVGTDAQDPHRVLTTDYLDDATVRADPRDGRIVIAALRDMADRIGASRVPIVSKRGVAITMRKAESGGEDPWNRVQHAWSRNATVEQRAEVFGDPGVPELLRYLAERNRDLTLRPSTFDEKPAVALRWDRR